jgi:transposase
MRSGGWILVEGISRRQVAKEMGVSRNTVRKYLKESEPINKRKKGSKRPVLEKAKARIDELITEWKDRTTKKQKLTSRRLYNQLITDGYKISESTVNAYFREKKRENLEVYIPLEHKIGEEAQVDFFEVTVEIKGEIKKCYMFLMRLMYSKRDFAWLYEYCDQVSFLDGHVKAFAHFGGAPKRCIYDNLKAAVKKVAYPQRELTYRFKALVSHYLFEPCFARPYEGHDKGGVEGRGKGIRYQLLVPIPRGENLDEISLQLLNGLIKQAENKKDIEGKTVCERFQEEQKCLLPLPKRPFEPRLVVLLIVNRKSLVRYGGAIYSLPSRWKLLEVTAYVGPKDIRFICRDEILTRRRVKSKGKNIHYKDYLPELRKKPQAVRQIAPELLNELGKPFDDLWKLLQKTHDGHGSGRIFAKVLGAIKEHGEDVVKKTLHQVIDSGQGNLLQLSELIRAPLPSKIEVPEPLRDYVVESSNASDFDHLLKEVSSYE